MKRKYQEDLDYFLNFAEQKRGKTLDKKYPNESMHLDFYFTHSKDELSGFIEEFKKNHTINDDYDFYYFMNCLIKYMSGNMDAHTNIIMNDNKTYPLSIQFINNKLYITKCSNEKCNYSELLEINKININKIIEEVEKCTSYGTPNWFLSRLHFYLSSKNILLSLPSIDSNSKYIEYKTSKGIIKYEVDKDYKNELAIVKKEEFKQIQIKNNILILKYPKCTPKFAPDVKSLKKLIRDNNIDTFILDLRGNTGGQSSLIEPLIKYLKRSKLKLVTLVNRSVFSSGRMAAIDMKKIGSKMVGQDIGTPINCFGFIFGNGKLPNTNFTFNFSKVYWYEDEKHIMKGIFTKNKLHKMPKEFYEPKYLKIDYYIDLTIDDYKSGNDVMLEKCCDWIKNNENGVTKNDHIRYRIW